MKRRRQIYEGKAKILYEGPEPGTVIQYFKDDTTAFDATKKATLDGKGVLNNRISEYLMTQLNAIGVPTHFVRRLNMREQLVKEVEIIPLEVVVRNVAAGSMSKRLGIEEGTVLPRSIIEYYYKSDKLHDPWVSEEHITAFGWAAPQDLDDMVNLSIRINDFLSGLFLASASSWSTSNWNSAGCGRTTICALCWPTRSAPIRAGYGTRPPTKRWTRTASAATWAAWSRPTARSQNGWASCPNRCRERSGAPCWCGSVPRCFGLRRSARG